MTRNPFTQKNMLSAPRYMTILGVGYTVVNKKKHRCFITGCIRQLEFERGKY